MKYKVGDKVRVVKGIDGSPQFPQFSPGGVVGMITDVNPTTLFAYTVANEDGTWCYPESALEPYIEKTYSDGLKDIWELAKKINSAIRKNKINEMCENVFGTNSVDEIFEIPAEEALAKLEAYEKKKDAKSFKVGDEVEFLDQYDRPTKGCVVGFYDRNTVSVADKNGDIEEWEKGKLTKTGTHYDEIENVFKRLDVDYER